MLSPLGLLGTRARMCFFEICSHGSPFRGSKTSKTQFWGVNRRFQAKLAKSKNVHIIKTTASAGVRAISTKFNRMTQFDPLNRFDR